MAKRKEKIPEQFQTLKSLLERKPIDVGTFFRPLLSEAHKVSTLIGLDKEIIDTLTSLAQNQNVLLIGLPGVGKTTLAKEIAQAAKVAYSRTDGNEDVEPSQIIGYIDKIAVAHFCLDHPLSIEMGDMLRAHGGIYHIDEINRIPPRSANALLQGLEEGYVWLSGYKVVSSFVSIATLNPATVTGTYELDEALMDRFDSVWLETPDVKLIEDILKLRSNVDWASLKVKISADVFKVTAKMIDLMVQDYKKDGEMEMPASVRAGIAAINKAIVYAYLRHSKQVTVEDLEKALVPSFIGRIKPCYEVAEDYPSKKKLVESYISKALR